MEQSTADLGTAWRNVVEELQPNQRAWLRASEPVTLHESTAIIAVPDEFTRGQLEGRLRGQLEDALTVAFAREIRLAVTVNPALQAPTGGGEYDQELAGDEVTSRESDMSTSGFESPELTDPSAVAHAEAPAVARPTALETRLNPKYTFETFVIGSSNRFPHAAAVAVAEAPGKAYNPLLVYGDSGLGKTHLLHAIGHFAAANHPELSVTYVSVETFTNEFINALRDGGIRSFKDRYRSTDVLLIDDIQSLQGREQTQEEFFHTFNALHDSGKQVVISSDRPPKAIATLEDRLRSRFEMGLITDVQPPDLETRIAILQKRVRADRYEIHEPEVLPFIAGRVSTNVRALEGALTRVVAHGSISGRRITVDLASEVLADLFPAEDGLLSIDLIQGEVCRYYGVTHDELTGDKRTRRIVGPRQVAMYLSRELTDASLPAIGRAYGGRDHTTVMYAVQKVGDQMAGEGEVLTAVQTLTGRLTGRRERA
ncbi:MAG: chromosomal replication initiator protein DnaA [Nocardioides sp.]